MRIDGSSGTLPNKKAPAMIHNECHKPARSGDSTRPEIRQSLNAVRPISDALGPHRTQQTRGLARRANERAQFHKRLIEVRGLLRVACCVSRGGGDELLGELPKFLVGRLFPWILLYAKNARQHADDIAIKNRAGFVECDAGNRPRRVTSDAWQC